MFPLGLCYFQVIFDDCIDVAVKANAQSKKKKKKSTLAIKIICPTIFYIE